MFLMHVKQIIEMKVQFIMVLGWIRRDAAVALEVRRFAVTCGRGPEGMNSGLFRLVFSVDMPRTNKTIRSQQFNRH